MNEMHHHSCIQFGDEVIVELMSSSLARESIVPELFTGLKNALDRVFPNAPETDEIALASHPSTCSFGLLSCIIGQILIELYSGVLY